MEAPLYTGPLPINSIGKKAAGVPTAGAPAKLVRQLKRIGLHAEQLAKGRLTFFKLLFRYHSKYRGASHEYTQ